MGVISGSTLGRGDGVCVEGLREGVLVGVGCGFAVFVCDGLAVGHAMAEAEGVSSSDGVGVGTGRAIVGTEGRDGPVDASEVGEADSDGVGARSGSASCAVLRELAA